MQECVILKILSFQYQNSNIFMSITLLDVLIFLGIEVHFGEVLYFHIISHYVVGAEAICLEFKSHLYIINTWYSDIELINTIDYNLAPILYFLNIKGLIFDVMLPVVDVIIDINFTGVWNQIL